MHSATFLRPHTHAKVSLPGYLPIHAFHFGGGFGGGLATFIPTFISTNQVEHTDFMVYTRLILPHLTALHLINIYLPPNYFNLSFAQ